MFIFDSELSMRIQDNIAYMRMGIKDSWLISEFGETMFPSADYADYLDSFLLEYFFGINEEFAESFQSKMEDFN